MATTRSDPWSATALPRSNGPKCLQWERPGLMLAHACSTAKSTSLGDGTGSVWILWSASTWALVSGSACLLFRVQPLVCDAVFYPSSLRTNKSPRVEAAEAICALFADGSGAVPGFESNFELNRYFMLLCFICTFVRRLNDYFSFLVNIVKLAFRYR